MGARPDSYRKQGGGFLNNVDGVISGYRFTDEFNGEPFVPGNKPGTKDPKFHSLYFELSARLDGADEDLTQNLFAGNADMFDISDDGLSITPTEEAGEDYELGQNTPLHKFIATLCENGFPVERLPEDGEPISYEAIIGTRVRFAQQVETDASGKPKKRVAKKGKFKGKEFDATTTVVGQVYELPGDGKKAGKASSGKPSKASKKDDGAEANDLAVETLIAIVSANKGKMEKGRLSMAVLRKLMKHPLCEAVRKLITSEEFLETENGWEYNAKKGVVTVEEDND